MLLMAISIICGYVFGILIEKNKSKNSARLFLVLSIIISLGLLAYFKYADFFIENFNTITGLSVPLLKLALPIGISFYTFQLLSYTVDVYRGDAAAQKNIIDFAAYVALFPQLIAGPIVRYVDIAPELEEHTVSFEKIHSGTIRFIIGLSKKVLIANALGELCDSFRSSADKSILFYWIYAIAYSLHIYYDFSGYSDMAIGLGRIFGFSFLENFNYPYISKSITEFWRRWHMSLGSWFRDYVYIPMGGNRTTKTRWLFNILVVWMLTGFWHGAEWNFIIWGLMFAILLIIEKLWLGKLIAKAPAFLSHIYVMFFVVLSFVIFNADGMGQALSDLGAMFGAASLPFATTETVYTLSSYWFIMLIAAIGATPIVASAAKKLNTSRLGERVLTAAEPAVIAALLLVITAYLVDGSFNPFLYFRF